jgi:hypothetical protein
VQVQVTTPHVACSTLTYWGLNHPRYPTQATQRCTTSHPPFHHHHSLLRARGCWRLRRHTWGMRTLAWCMGNCILTARYAPRTSVFLPWRYRQTWRYRHRTSGNRQRLKFQIIATAVGTIATLSPRMRRAIATFSIVATSATITNTT